MTKKITRREVRETHVHVIAVPYEALHFLLCCRRPYAHTERREGWGADVYSIGTCAIATGYAPFGDVKPLYDVLKKYEEMAKCVHDRFLLDLDYEKEKEALDDLLWRFIAEVLGKEVEQV